MVGLDPLSASGTGIVTGSTPGLLVRVAEEVWRLGKRADRAARLTGEKRLRGIRESVLRLQDALADHRVRLEDHFGEPYREGMRLDILHVDGDPGSEGSLWIIETVKPTVLLDEQVLSAGQVILGSNPPHPAIT